MQINLKGVTLIAVSTALALPALSALAQSTAPATPSSAMVAQRADAADPKAVVPPLVYNSVLQGYRPNVEAEVGAWKEINDNVGRIGGWRIYAKEARQPDAAASGVGAASTPAGSESKPMSAGHAGHKMN